MQYDLLQISTIAIIGRPNVGKSTLFNRIVGYRKQVVDKISGVTRDRIYAEVDWQDKKFQIIDTGGIGYHGSRDIAKLVKKQAELAIEEADFIIFLCDVRDGILPLDEEIVQLLRKKSKAVFLVVNKADNQELEKEKTLFYKLGLGKPYAVSSLHGSGVADMLDDIVKEFPKISITESSQDKLIKIAIVGRPNVGKSTFLNILLKQERVIVNKTPGTTRDAVDAYLKQGSDEFLLVDTAGIRHKRKVKEELDMYGISRSVKAIKASNISLVIIDAWEGLTQDDMRIMRIVQHAGKGLILLANKWDLVQGTIDAKEYETLIKRKANFTVHIPIIFTSCLNGLNVNKSLDIAKYTYMLWRKQFSTSLLNKILKKIIELNSPKSKDGKKLNFYYITQVRTMPPEFHIFTNFPDVIKNDYKIYINNRLIEKLSLFGIPVRIKYRGKA